MQRLPATESSPHNEYGDLAFMALPSSRQGPIADAGSSDKESNAISRVLLVSEMS